MCEDLLDHRVRWAHRVRSEHRDRPARKVPQARRAQLVPKV